MQAFMVWFVDGSATCIDAENEKEARYEIEKGIIEHKYYGIIEAIENLTTGERTDYCRMRNYT